jgi:hypothetical protein
VSGWGPQITRLYRLLLACYPPGFRAEFGGEMQEVFATALREAHHAGEERPWRLCWREIRDWPGSVLGEHLRERRRKMPSTGFHEKPPSRSELLVAMALFALPLLGILGQAGIRLPRWLDNSLLILCAGALLLVLGWAFVKRFPRWSLPYLGLVLLLGIILLAYDRIWGWIYPLFLELFGPRFLWSIPVRVVYVAVYEFIVLFSFLLAALILVNLLRLLPYTRGVWQRVRADWTRLSFLLYGGLVFNLGLLFEEYRYDELWQFMAWISLALGAWWYLRARGQKQRILALIGGATGAMWIVALAKWVLIPLQKWPAGYPVSPSEVTRWVETDSAMTGWVCILLMLLAPALLSLLPRAPDPILSLEGDPVTT